MLRWWPGAGEAVTLSLIRSVTGVISAEMDHILMNTWLARQAATSEHRVTIKRETKSVINKIFRVQPFNFRLLLLNNFQKSEKQKLWRFLVFVFSCSQYIWLYLDKIYMYWKVSVNGELCNVFFLRVIICSHKFYRLFVLLSAWGRAPSMTRDWQKDTQWSQWV